MEERDEVFSALGEITLPRLQVCEFGLNLCTVQDFQALLGGAFVIVAAMITAVAVLIANQRSVKAMRVLAEATRDMGRATLDGIETQEAYRREVDFHKLEAARHQETAQLASAFIGEIEALLKIAEVREMKTSFATSLEHAKYQDEEVVLSAYPTGGDFFHVYTGSTQKLGILDTPMPERLAEFYTRAFAYLDYNQGVYDGGYDDFGDAERIEVLKGLLGDITFLEHAVQALLTDLQQHRSKSERLRDEHLWTLRSRS